MVPDSEFYWHATPLQFLPHILQEGALRASANPRPSALARRKKLGLLGYVHLSLTSHTPLLADKLARGYPHALLAFPSEIAATLGAGYLKWNTKRWAHREEFVPLTSTDEKRTFLQEWRTGKYPSAELLVPQSLPLTQATGLYFSSATEADWLTGLTVLGLPTPPIQVAPERFPESPTPDLTALHAWASACRAAATLLPPLELPFD